MRGRVPHVSGEEVLGNEESKVQRVWGGSMLDTFDKRQGNCLGCSGREEVIGMKSERQWVANSFRIVQVRMRSLLLTHVV